MLLPSTRTGQYHVVDQHRTVFLINTASVLTDRLVIIWFSSFAM